MRELVGLLTVMVIVNLFQLLLYPYHLAPIVPLMYCLIAAGAASIYRGVARLSPRRERYFAAGLVVALLFSTGFRLFADQIGVSPSSYWERGYEWQRDARSDIVRWLSKRPRKQLVIVRYGGEHPVNQEWVYNGADINGSKIIWARELDDESDRQLLQYYADREVWLVEADVYPQRVIPYPRWDKEAPGENGCGPCSVRRRDVQTASNRH
jgi:hypothetical protein